MSAGYGLGEKVTTVKQGEIFREGLWFSGDCCGLAIEERQLEARQRKGGCSDFRPGTYGGCKAER